jgi:hypothetical protein
MKALTSFVATLFIAAVTAQAQRWRKTNADACRREESHRRCGGESKRANAPGAVIAVVDDGGDLMAAESRQHVCRWRTDFLRQSPHLRHFQAPD